MALGKHAALPIDADEAHRSAILEMQREDRLDENVGLVEPPEVETPFEPMESGHGKP